jgi:hypothetical protein
VLIDYGNDAWERLVLPVGRAMGIRTMALETRLARSKLINLFQGRSSPQAATRALVTGVVTSWVGSQLSTAPGATSYDPPKFWLGTSPRDLMARTRTDAPMDDCAQRAGIGTARYVDTLVDGYDAPAELARRLGS